jgi:hypothetical protein
VRLIVKDPDAGTALATAMEPAAVCRVARIMEDVVTPAKVTPTLCLRSDQSRQGSQKERSLHNACSERVSEGGLNPHPPKGTRPPQSASRRPGCRLKSTRPVLIWALSSHASSPSVGSH